MACFQKRSGSWRAIVKRRGYSVLTQTFNTKAQAEAWAIAIESKMTRGAFVSRAEAERTTLTEALARYQDTVNVAQHKSDL
ncbi:MAG: hypothetical protein ACYDEV_07300 [Acidiferrobacter sp.]